jgi:5-methylcytosine-specific restriction endonuclease McrA
MWMKVDDKLHDHPKVQRLLERYDETDALAAMGLWVLSGSWSGDHMSDGVMTPYILKRWHGDWQRLAAMLVDVGLWEVVDVEDRSVHQFHDWTHYNDSKAKIMADRIARQLRKELFADPDLIKAIRARDGDRCRYCGCLVRWGNQRGPSGATYDHVIPVGRPDCTNTLKNVVTACRGCNARKKDMTPEEAGMRLLRPGTLGAPAPEGLNPSDSPSGSGLVGSGAGSGPSPDSIPDPIPPKRTRKATTTQSRTRSKA